jgi:hypothetical protein
MKFDGDYAVRSSFEVSQTSLIVPLTMAALAETIESVEHFQCRRLEWAGKELAAYECSGLMYPDTDLGENARHGEVFDEQAKTYIFP